MTETLFEWWQKQEQFDYPMWGHQVQCGKCGNWVHTTRDKQKVTHGTPCKCKFELQLAFPWGNREAM